MSVYSHSTSPQYAPFTDSWTVYGTQRKAMTSGGGIMPTIPTKSSIAFGFGSQDTCQSMLSGTFRGHVSWLNSAWTTLS